MLAICLTIIAAVLILLYNRASLQVFTLSAFALLSFFAALQQIGWPPFFEYTLILLIIALPFNITWLRRNIFSRFILMIYKNRFLRVA